MEFWSEEFEEKLWKSMPVYMTYRPKPKTRLTCFAPIGCTLFNWVSCIADRRRQLSCISEGVYSDATQINLTRRQRRAQIMACTVVQAVV